MSETMCYVARGKDGFVHAVAVVGPDAAKSVAQWVKEGKAIETMTASEAREELGRFIVEKKRGAVEKKED